MNPDFILSEPARRVLAWWKGSAPGPDLLPGRQHFDPVDFGTMLPSYFLTDVGPDLAFRFRLAGGVFVELWDSNFAGRDVGEATFGENGAHAVALYRSVCRSRQATLSSEKIVVNRTLELDYQVLMVPLATDGRTIDMILGSFDCDAKTQRAISNFVPLTREQWKIVSIRHLDA